MSQKADIILRGTENEADAIVTVPGVVRGRVYFVNFSRGLLAYKTNEWVTSINKKFIFSDLHCLTMTVLHDFALFRQLK